MNNAVVVWRIIHIHELSKLRSMNEIKVITYLMSLFLSCFWTTNMLCYSLSYVCYIYYHPPRKVFLKLQNRLILASSTQLVESLQWFLVCLKSLSVHNTRTLVLVLYCTICNIVFEISAESPSLLSIISEPSSAIKNKCPIDYSTKLLLQQMTRIVPQGYPKMSALCPTICWCYAELPDVWRTY